MDRTKILPTGSTDIYEVSKKFWIAEYFPEDLDGGELAPDGRVIEMLSEHTVEGMLEGYLLKGRHGFISSYEAFIHVIDSSSINTRSGCPSVIIFRGVRRSPR